MLLHFGPKLPPLPATLPSYAEEPDWKQASPVRIQRALRHALAKPSGGWYVLDGSRTVGRVPRRFEVEGQELVAFRDTRDDLVVAPAACPHMGADLSCGRVEGDRIVCPWHGLALGRAGHGRWQPLPSYDDGALAWVRLPEAGAPPSPRPLLPPRPARFLDAVIRMEARCEPEDVLANRLDPWHGAHFHPHSFARLRVLDDTEERLVVRVSYRVAGPVASEVDASFHCSDPRTIVMTILAGEGTGSVVETHATPLGPGRTAIVEATLVTSDRIGFPAVRVAARWIRPALEARARRLWVEDAAYAERTYALRLAQGQRRERHLSVVAEGDGAKAAGR